jgi:hypothetical protein
MIMVLTWVFVLRGGFHDQLWLQLWLQLGRGELAPEGFGHPVGRLPAEGSGDVGITLGLAEPGVPEDLLNHADANALVEQQGRGRVACILRGGPRGMRRSSTVRRRGARPHDQERAMTSAGPTFGEFVSAACRTYLLRRRSLRR